MDEVYVFAEGELFVWRGAVEPTEPVAYVEAVQVYPLKEYANPRSINGVYRHHLIGRRVDATFTIAAAISGGLSQFLENDDPVHIHVRSTIDGVSAGVRCYSGRVTTLGHSEAQADITRRSMQFIGNQWSYYE